MSPTVSDQRLLCVTTSMSPPNDPPKNQPAADSATAVLGRCLRTHDVYVEPTMIFASAGNVVPPPSLVVPSLGTSNNISSTTAKAASVA